MTAAALLRLSAGVVAFEDGAQVAHPALELRAGDRVAVVGPNGSGKSTLLRVVAGLVATSGVRETALGGDGIGWVGQRPFLFRTSVRENVALGWPRGAPGRDDAVRAALAATGADAFADRAARTLSEGQQARVAVARAFVRRPRLLVLDEPFAALDAEGVARLVAALDAAGGVAVVAAAPREDGLAALRPARTLRLGG